MTLSRAERRAETDGRILDAARRLFAERGYERTTIRSVASAARVDPALIMQRFTSKQHLFDRAVQPAGSPGPAADPVEEVLGTLGWKLGELPPESLAMLRSMLTHPEAAASARSALTAQIGRLEASLDGTDARLRATLITLVMLGVTIGHQLLHLEELRDTPPEEIAGLLRPSLQALTADPAP
ncbi:TetR/AcrR family transcriptional regulator [Actinocorallia longicatena]|uniref:TetR/AcrR family transcriptional regulator n=1 Tax=Actinocorallia longicatena TaxID=111803 RepID=A0ABP6PX51_9ACTN